MRSKKDFFNRPAFASVTPEKKRFRTPEQAPSPPSPLANNPLPPTIDLTSTSSNTLGSRPKGPLFNVVDDRPPNPTPPDQSSQSLPCTDEAPPSSLNESFQASQRIVKDGKEVVISSDGEETDSDSSLAEDPASFFARKFNTSGKSSLPKIVPPPKPIITTPKKYRNTIDALVVGAVDDDETEANVAKVRAGYTKPQRNGAQQGTGPGITGAKNGLHEEILTSALGNENEEDGGDLRRLLDAVRRTEALDHDKTWRFLDQTQIRPVVVKFPRHLFSPTSSLAALRDPQSRERLFQSGILEFVATLPSQSQPLPDEFILWLFRSMPLEPREELRRAYCRVITKSTRVTSIIQPSDIDYVFKQLGASPQALDFSKPIEQAPSNQSHQESSLKDRASLISIFSLLRDASQLFNHDTLDRAIQTLLRMTIDTSLTADDMIRSELQSCLMSLLENVSDDNIEEMQRRICLTVYETFRDVQFQSHMLQHILPSTPWISLLRYRLAMAFLLRSPDPLTEPAQDVLDLERLTRFLIRDERLQVKSYGKKANYDYGDLTAIAMLLDVVINSSLYDLKYRQANTETKFNEAMDKVAAQIKRIFSSIEDSGAAHLKRVLAKQALEGLHYRVLFSVRSRPPPKRGPFKSEAQKDGNLGNFFKAKKTVDVQDSETSDADGEGTAIPIRKHASP